MAVVHPVNPRRFATLLYLATSCGRGCAYPRRSRATCHLSTGKRVIVISKYLENIPKRAGDFICTYRGTKAANSFNAAVQQLHRSLNNQNFDIDTNGERRALTLIADTQPKLIFDVGSNVGQWSERIREISPHSTIHAFEIVPATFKRLRRRTKEFDDYVINNVGLSNETGKITINLGKHSTSSTAFKIEARKFHDNYYTDEVECETITGKDYMASNEIDAIDLLKIDTEGMDLRVIKGFGDQLKNVKVIQFEYGIFNISSHDLLADFFSYLTKRGFVIGKIFPRHVDFFKYDWPKENFYGANFLAVRKSEQELIEKLRTYSH